MQPDSDRREPLQTPLPGRLEGALPFWLKVVPFFLSAALFFSGFFSVFAPLPLLVVASRSRRGWAWIAVLTNAALVWSLAGPFSSSLYGVLIGVLALSLPEFLKARLSLSKTVGLTLLSVLLAGAAALSVYSWVHHFNPLIELRTQVDANLKSLVDSLGPEARSSWFGTEEDASFDDIRKSVMTELPSALGIVVLALVWTNLLLLLRLNPGRIRERVGVEVGFFRGWKAPEWLVWPTILSGVLLIFDVGPVSVVALNVFKFLMAVYALQGLSILGYFFDVWKVRGFFRSVGYVVSLLVMLPLLLSLGFFDLWFDFRSKLRQS